MTMQHTVMNDLTLIAGTKASPPHDLAVIDALAAPAREGAGEVAGFDYEALAVEARLVVQQLAREIRDDLEEVELRGIRMGRRLLEVREHLPRGTWRAWLRAELPRISPDTAENLIQKARLAARMPNYSALESRFEETALTRLAKPSTPTAAVEEALRRAEGGEFVRSRDAAEIVRAAKAVAAAGAGTGPASPASPSPETFVARTDQGQVAIPILRRAGDLALHRIPEGVARGVGDLRISHIPTGMPLPRDFAGQGAAETALELLAALDWSQVSGTEVPPALAAQIRTVLGVPAPAAPGGQPERAEAGAAARPSPASDQVKWRQPYGAAGSGRFHPIVPHILIVERRSSWYVPAPLRRLVVRYDTETSVRVELEGGRQQTVAQQQAYCLPTDAAWAEVRAAHAAYGAALAALAGRLRALGRYHTRLAELGGHPAAPNPLNPTVLFCEDPAAELSPSWCIDPWQVPSVTRHAVARHTAKMLYRQYGDEGGGGGYETGSMQHHFTVCPDAATWAAVAADVAAAVAAGGTLLALLKSCGTYQEASADGRYTGGVAVSTARAGAQAAPSGATSAEATSAERDRAALIAAARVVYEGVIAALSDDQLALIAAASWPTSGRPWHAATRAELGAALLARWVDGLTYELEDPNPEVAREVARRAGLVPASVAVGMAAGCAR